MIRINLLGEKVDHSATYTLQGILYVGSVLLSVFLIFLIHDSIVFEKLAKLDEKQALERRLTKLNQVTQRVKELEDKQKTLKEKLTTIAVLKKKKNGPVHVLDDLTNALPEKAWVSDITQRDGIISIKGVALDNQTIAEFMAKVGKYPLFDTDKVELVKSTEFLRDSVKLKEFFLTVQLKGLQPVIDESAPKEPGRPS
jgi:type IV pilus assembly protein PilN